MNAIAYAVLGYLVAQALVLLATALVSEWRHPSRNAGIRSPFVNL